MKIACLGWGSLIWEPKKLKIQKEWSKDGPILPIEFTRLSEDGRMTLVIDTKNTKSVRTLWALMNTSDIKKAQESLFKREFPKAKKIDNLDKKILFIEKSGDINGNTDSNEIRKIKLIIQNWLKEKNIDVAIWTGLGWSSNKNKEGDEKGEFGGKRPYSKQVVIYLNKLEGAERCCAEQYIRKTPKQIDTACRRAIEKELGWTYKQTN